MALGCVFLGAGIGLAMAPASSSLMSSFPRDHAGVGSAMNDTFQEMGAALGVAVLGGIATATYRSGLPASVPEAARDSYGATLALARGEGSAGSGLAAAARSAFDLAVQHSLVGGSVAALVGAVVGLVVLGAPGGTGRPGGHDVSAGDRSLVCCRAHSARAAGRSAPARSPCSRRPPCCAP